MSVIGCSHDRASLQRHRGAGQSRLVVDEALGEPRVKTGDEGIRKQPHAACADLGGSFCGRDKGRHAAFRIWTRTSHGQQTCIDNRALLGTCDIQHLRAMHVPDVATNVSHSPVTEGGGICRSCGVRVFLFVWGYPSIG